MPQNHRSVALLLALAAALLLFRLGSLPLVGPDEPRYARVALPGGAACLAGHSEAFHARHALERQLDFLIREHGLNRIVLIAHEGCAFYRDLWLGLRTMKQQQAVDLEKAATAIRMANPQVEVAMYFANKVGGKIMFEC